MVRAANGSSGRARVAAAIQLALEDGRLTGEGRPAHVRQIYELLVRDRGYEGSYQALIGTLSHSRAKFCWVSEDQSQVAWHTGHLELFGRYWGVPLWVRIDNLKTGVAEGSGSEIDPFWPATGSDKGKAERGVRTLRSARCCAAGRARWRSSAGCSMIEPWV